MYRFGSLAKPLGGVTNPVHLVLAEACGLCGP